MCFKFSCGLLSSIRLIRKPRSVIFQMEFQIRWNMIFMPTRPKSTTYLHDFSLWLFHTFFSNTYMFVYYIHFWKATRNSFNKSANTLKFFVILHFQMWSCLLVWNICPKCHGMAKACKNIRFSQQVFQVFCQTKHQFRDFTVH